VEFGILLAVYGNADNDRSAGGNIGIEDCNLSFKRGYFLFGVTAGSNSNDRQYG
jgi:hypothetical protein